ncbi:MAG TPA: PadR family transcriptional regulator [Blastocatellia bacterium]|nr:PadR family transcriptional regulator [Blastocatellia bacterium]
MGKGYLSYSVAVILQALDHGYRYGFDIMDITGLPSGTVYPALRRLEEAGFVRSKWEKQAIAQQELRPPRKYYELTREGTQALAEALQRYRLLESNRAEPMRKPKPAQE